MPRARRRKLGVAFGVGAFVFLIVSGIAASFYTDLLWFTETGFTSVFWREVSTKATLGAVFGLIFAVLLLVNLWVVQKITSPYRLFTAQDQILERYRMTLRPYVRRGAAAMAIVFGLFAGSGATTQWRNWLLFSHQQRFGESDPIFGKDLGFFVFRLPFHRFLFSWTFSTLVVITIIVALAHYFMGGIRQAPAGERVAPAVKAHLSVLFGVIVLLKAWGYRLDQFNLLYSSRGSVDGASYTDVHAQMPALRLLVFIAIVCGILFLVNIRFRGWTLPTAGIAILAVTSIAAGAIYPAVVQRVRVAPAERDRERPYIERNIKATRAAFGIDNRTVDVSPLPPDSPLTKQMLAERRETVENIRLWKPELLSLTFTQLQRNTNFYEFPDVDVDRYDVAGARRQIMISAREVATAELPERAKTWQNLHLFYTHGFGVVASRVNAVTPEGQPDFVIADIPPKSIAGAPEIKEPRIYFGEIDDPQFVVVRSKTLELDYPRGQTSFVSSQYAGKGGIEMKGFLRKLAFAWRFRDVNLVLSNQISSTSRIMFRRGVADRVQRVAPFLQLDADPYIAIVNDRLVWIQDAYTTSDMYPYSERVSLADLTDRHLRGRANYIRNSVKATVDALDGTVTLYQWDDKDPVINAWREIFPKAFRPAAEMPAELRSHVRYPEDLFRVQAEQFALYHITDPIDFYTRTDVWRIPNDPTRSASQDPKPFTPYYVLMSLPDSNRAEFVLMIPFTPFSAGENPRQNMTAWLAARSDPDVYGKLRAFEFGKQKVVSGPEQVFTRMINDSIVSRDLALLDPTTTRQGILYGNLLVIPIDDSILYVMPVYRTTAAGSRLPELKRVIVVARDKISIADTLKAAIDGLFAARTPSTGPPAAGATVAELVGEALAHFQAAQRAFAAGDFTTYGAELEKLEQALRAANQEASPSPSPAPSR
jgi:hypothetical protein